MALDEIREGNLTPPSLLDAPSVRLLAGHKWQSVVFIVFDIGNEGYNSESAHLPEQNNLPVMIVHLRRRRSVKWASAELTDRINEEVAQAHNCHGNHSVPPFMVDYTTGVDPLYPNPRDASLLRQ